MVDSIKGGAGSKIIIIKPKTKAETEGTGKSDFADRLKGKAGATATGGPPRTDHFSGSVPTGAATINPAMYQPQVQRKARLEEIERQIRDGDYQLVDAEVLADRLVAVFTDRRAREKLVKKLLQEQKEALGGLQGPALNVSQLELKRMVQVVKNSQEEPFDDPELEALIREFS